jgi:hypothetical protein
MPEFDVTFRTPTRLAGLTIDAKSGERALVLARRLCLENPLALDWDHYTDSEDIEEIEAIDEDGNAIVWRARNLRLHLAAEPMRELLKEARLALNIAPRFKVQGTDSYAIASKIDTLLAELERSLTAR